MLDAKSKSDGLIKACEKLRVRQRKILIDLALKYQKDLAVELVSVTDAIALVNELMTKEGLKLVANDASAAPSRALPKSRRA
jgi:hypothetical protein